MLKKMNMARTAKSCCAKNVTRMKSIWSSTPNALLDTDLLKDAVASVESLAGDLRTPVLSGVSIGEGYEAAAYANPNPKSFGKLSKSFAI